MHFKPISIGYHRVLRAVLVVPLAIVLLGPGSAPVAAAGRYHAQVALLENREYSASLLRGIAGARKSILLSCYLFKITDSYRNQPRMIAEELVNARNRGVIVTVIMERARKSGDRLYEENRRTADFLMRGGVQVLFDSPRRVSHLKLAVIDERYVYLGSHNLTQSALQYNNELSVLIDSPAMAAELKSYLNQL